jgi:putative ABC transport system substrate-binding protein
MRRREFITLLGSGAIAWPLAARAQSERMRVIGLFGSLAESDPEAKIRAGAFLQGLQKLGWTEGTNLRIFYRWAAGDPNRRRAYAAEFAAMKPEVIFVAGNIPLSALLRVPIRDVPIVFAQIPEPVEFVIGPRWVVHHEC